MQSPDPLRPQATDYVAGEGWFFANIGKVNVTFIDDIVDEARFVAFRDAFGRNLDEMPDTGKYCVLHEVRRGGLGEAGRRRAIGEMLAARKEKLARGIAGYALATESLLVRGTLKALNWLAPPPYESHVVGTPREGIVWLAKRLPEVNPGATLRVYNGLKVRYIAGV